MKKLNFTTKTAIALYAMLAVVLFTGCSDGSKYDKLILTDPNTGKQYLVKHNVGDTYMIDEKVVKISGKDTISVFE
jgi:hypothetical protein